MEPSPIRHEVSPFDSASWRMPVGYAGVFGEQTEWLRPPPAEGTPWRDGAVGNAEWGGVLLRDLLRLVSPGVGTVEVLFVGADKGVFKETGEQVPFARSLPLAAAMGDGALLAFTMNGEPLPFRHGGPVRLIVPRWYGMASVKWVMRIELLTRPFRGPFQVRDYVYLPARGAYDKAAPVTYQKVNSVIVSPAPGQTLKPGPVRTRGLAWGGASPLASVEVSLDNGGTWAEAELVGPEAQAAWRRWEFVTPPLPQGSYELVVRAKNADGHVQPEAAPWNAKGYGNNERPRVRFVVSLLAQRRKL